MSEVQTNERPKVTALTQISYGLCEMGSTMCASIGTQYFAFFITDILMMSAAVMTPILLIGRIGDFVTILISSIVVERVNMRWGKYRSFLLVCAPLAYIFFLAQYARLAGEANGQANMIIGVICYVVSFGIFNFGRTATMALLNVLGRDQKEKAMLSARKGQFASITPLIFGATFLPLGLIFSGAAETGTKTDLTGKGFFLATVVFYTVYLVCNMIFFKATKPYDLPGENNGGQKKAKLSIKEMTEQIIGNKALIFLLLAQTINGAANNVITSGAIYYFKVVAKDLTLQPIYSSVTSIVGIAGAVVLGELNAKIGKKNLAIFGSALSIVVLLAIRFFTFGKSVWIYIVLMAFQKFGSQAIQVCGVGMFGDCVEYGKYKLGKEARGFIMGLFMIPVKLGVVIGAPILSSGLAAVNYDAKMAITEEVQMGVFNTITFVPACVMGLSLLCYILYPLSKKKIAEVIEANKGK